MAIHAVPQDVEADDKLIGPLSLKQFIFTIIGLGFGYLAFFFFTKVHPLISLVWLPFAIVFLVLGLYQRKDQPAEVFLASALGFFLKPKVRIWNQAGYDERVHITAPPVIEKKYTKDFSGEEARGRLANLSLMMDSRGWASKKVDDWQNPQMATVAADDSDRIISRQDVASRQTVNPLDLTKPADPYDNTSLVGQQFAAKIQVADDQAHQTAVHHMQQAAQQTTNASTQNSSSNASDNSTSLMPSINDESVVEKINTTQPIPIIENSVQTTDSPKGDDSNRALNVAHENEDGSVELKLH